jgi:hypothetical protein
MKKKTFKLNKKFYYHLVLKVNLTLLPPPGNPPKFPNGKPPPISSSIPPNENPYYYPPPPKNIEKIYVGSIPPVLNPPPHSGSLGSTP